MTGHRPVRLVDADYALLRERVRDVLVTIANLAPELPMIVISPLAEGADRLIAREAVNAGHLLDCILPFPRDDYAKDFAGAANQAEYYALLKQATSVIELHGSRATPEQTDAAYMAAGELVVEHADVMIAIWDGVRARGRGGTGDVVELALACYVPIIWIDATPPHEIRLIARDGTSGFADHSLSMLAKITGRRAKTPIKTPDP